MNGIRTEDVLVAVAFLCAAIGAGFDIHSRKIPNLLTAPSMVIALGLHLTLGGWRGMGESALTGLLAGGVLFLLFLVGGMGAGDVKLMAAVGCFTGLRPIGVLLLGSAIYGALFGIAVAFERGRLREVTVNALELLQHHSAEGIAPHPEINLASSSGLRIPFGVPIALSCLSALCLQLYWRG